QLGPGAVAERERKRAEKSGHGCHENGTETQQARFVNSFDGSETVLRLGLNGKINHENGIFLDDTDEKNDANIGDHGKFRFEKHQGEERANSRGRNRRKNGDGMDETLVENAEDDVNGSDGSDQQNEDGGLRVLEGLRGALEPRMNGR